MGLIIFYGVFIISQIYSATIPPFDWRSGLLLFLAGFLFRCWVEMCVDYYRDRRVAGP